MKAIAADDEPLMLHALTKAISASEDISSVSTFLTCAEAIEWSRNNPVDVAFLDINMRGMGGLALAEKLIEFHPHCKIIFCTGYEQYAVEAFRLHVSGYLMKPIAAEDVQRELDYIKKNTDINSTGKNKTEKLLTVRCFGEFEVYSHGKRVHFPRRKSKELLAYLIDRQGASVSGQKIAAVLWESDNIEKNLNYLRQISLNLRRVLENIGAKEVLDSRNKQYSLKIELIDCDYFEYLKTGTPLFQGEYMVQYSWAEETCGLLWKK